MVARLAAAQSSLGHTVRILSYDRPEAAERTARTLSAIPEFPSLRCYCVPRDGFRERLYAPEARQQLASILPQVDVVHLHGVWEPLILASAREAFRQGVPYCLCPHGMLHPWSLQQKRLKKILALRLGYRAMLDRAAFLHVLNEGEMGILSRLGLKAPTAVLPNGVFMEEIDPLPPRGRFRLRHPALEDDPFILFLGRLHRKKGLDVLIEAFSRLAAVHPTVRLVVAGPDDGAQAAVEIAARASGCGQRVHLVGPVYGEEKWAALSDASCFCLPSRQEGFSVAILEALACGVPVVISEECHFPEVADHAAGQVVALSAGAVHQALFRVFSNPGKAHSMGANGRALVLDRFLWPEIARCSADAYATVFAPAPVETASRAGLRAGVLG